MPEATMSMVMAIIDKLAITPEHKVLDFGCAKGYVVKAFRLLRRQAWGCDISSYAIGSGDELVKDYIRLVTNDPVPFKFNFDFVTVKDVLEHIPEEELKEILKRLRECSDVVLVIVPLGENGEYFVPAYNLDPTHCTAWPWMKWKFEFENAGFNVRQFLFRFPGVKDNWAHNEYGNGFFILE